MPEVLIVQKATLWMFLKTVVHLLEECFLGLPTSVTQSALPEQTMPTGSSPNSIRKVTLPGQQKLAVPAQLEFLMSLPYQTAVPSSRVYGKALQHLAAPLLPPVPLITMTFLSPSLIRMVIFYGLRKGVVQAVMNLPAFLRSVTAVQL